MIHRQNSITLSEKIPSSPLPKKAKQVHLNVKMMLVMFLILIRLFTTDLSHRVKPLTSTSTKVSSSIYERLSGLDNHENDSIIYMHDKFPFSSDHNHFSFNKRILIFQ
jgi:hypothetical protein